MTLSVDHPHPSEYRGSAAGASRTQKYTAYSGPLCSVNTVLGIALCINLQPNGAVLVEDIEYSLVFRSLRVLVMTGGKDYSVSGRLLLVCELAWTTPGGSFEEVALLDALNEIVKNVDALTTELPPLCDALVHVQLTHKAQRATELLQELREVINIRYTSIWSLRSILYRNSMFCVPCLRNEPSLLSQFRTRTIVFTFAACDS